MGQQGIYRVDSAKAAPVKRQSRLCLPLKLVMLKFSDCRHWRRKPTPCTDQARVSEALKSLEESARLEREAEDALAKAETARKQREAENHD